MVHFLKSLNAKSFILFFLPLCIGCTSTPINLNPQLNIIESNIGSGKKVSVHVYDERLDDEISQGYEIKFGITSGESETKKGPSIIEMLQIKISDGLKKKGFEVSEKNQSSYGNLIVAIRRIQTTHRYAPFFRIGFVSAQSTIKAKCSHGEKKYEKNYRSETETTTHYEDAGREYKENQLNNIFAKVLEEMLQDKKLIHCLR